MNSSKSPIAAQPKLGMQKAAVLFAAILIGAALGVGIALTAGGFALTISPVALAIFGLLIGATSALISSIPSSATAKWHTLAQRTPTEWCALAAGIVGLALALAALIQSLQV